MSKIEEKKAALLPLKTLMLALEEKKYKVPEIKALLDGTLPEPYSDPMGVISDFMRGKTKMPHWTLDQITASTKILQAHLKKIEPRKKMLRAPKKTSPLLEEARSLAIALTLQFAKSVLAKAVMQQAQEIDNSNSKKKKIISELSKSFGETTSTGKPNQYNVLTLFIKGKTRTPAFSPYAGILVQAWSQLKDMSEGKNLRAEISQQGEITLKIQGGKFTNLLLANGILTLQQLSDIAQTAIELHCKAELATRFIDNAVITPAPDTNSLD